MLIASCGNRHGDVDDEAVAMLIASCGNRHGDVDDEAVQVAVGLRLELDLCVRDNCYCGTPWPMVCTVSSAKEILAGHLNITTS